MRALVIGIDSLIGHKLGVQLEASGWDVIGTSRRGKHGTLFLDLEQLPNKFELPVVDTCFICAAVTSQKFCEEHETITYRVNTEAPVLISQLIIQKGGQVVFLSSNAVFNGRSRYPLPTDSTSPSNAYGRQKAEAESKILDISPRKSAIVRLTKVLSQENQLFSGWIRSLKMKNPIEAFADKYFSPLNLEDAINALKRIAETQSSGIFHASSTHDITYIDAARYLANRLGVSPGLVTGVFSKATDSDRLFTSLESSRLAELTGIQARNPFEVLSAVYGV